MSSFLTKHAQKQDQKRSISIDAISFIIEESDIRRWSGDGCISLQVSRKRLKKFRDLGYQDPCLADKANGVVFIPASDGAIFTVMHKARRFKKRKYCPKKLQIRRAKFGGSVAKQNRTQFLQFLFSQLLDLANLAV